MTEQDSWCLSIFVMVLMRASQSFFSCLAHTHLLTVDYVAHPLMQQQPILAACIPHSLAQTTRLTTN